MTGNGIPEAEIKPPPDRISMDQRSEYFYREYFRIGVKLDGKVIFDCVEYCVSQGWCRRYLKLPNGKTRLERGQPITLMHLGKIEPYWR